MNGPIYELTPVDTDELVRSYLFIALVSREWKALSFNAFLQFIKA